MGKVKKSKEKKHRSRSSSRDRNRKSHKKEKRSNSTSSSEADSDGEKFNNTLDKARHEKKRLKELEKQRLKDKETPEEKRARRMAKKVAKSEKKRKEGESYLPPQLAYTNMNNPFNDVKLTETFVWGKKLEREGKVNLSQKQIEKETRHRVEKNVREMEELKRARDARLAAKDDLDMIQRDMDRRAHGEWSQKETQFQLEQAKVRSQLRIEQNRAKPIDLLSRYILYGDDKKDEDQDVKPADDEFEMNDPLSYIRGLTQGDYEDLVEDIKVYRNLEGEKHVLFWQDVRAVVDDELKRLRDERDRTTIHESVQADVTKIIKGKNASELAQLEISITGKIRAGGTGIDVSYWELLLEHLKVYIAKTRLRELHQSMLKLRLRRIREEQMTQVGSVDEAALRRERKAKEPKKEVDMEDKPAAIKPSTSSIDDHDEEELRKQTRKKVDLNDLEGAELDDQEKELKWRALDAEQLELATVELYERGCYSPTYGRFDDTMPGIEVLDADADMESLRERRKQNRKKPDGLASVDPAMVAIAKKGMDKDEATFAVEQPVEAQVHLWSAKYRPRKPTYLNRVQTGFDWNKYNQTHYDMDNPPPKIVQGYKFNIFYPDLLDKKETPSFTVTPCDDPDFAVIRFKSGPPYEDIAFKCVNREWEVGHKNGYKCQFQNGVFQLWFQFKKYRYRR